MPKLSNLYISGLIAVLAFPSVVLAQIDPDKRELIEFGYNQAVEGASPLSAYAYYYYNQPSFLDHTNLTLRLAIAPTYIDSELGFSHLLGPNTDLGVGLSGGGFADSYYEIRQGKFYKGESFDGNGVTGSANVYHLFDPGQRIPLNGLIHGELHYADYVRDDTYGNFVLPSDQTSLNIRTGFRFGGKEPVLVPDVALELSAWYEGQVRLDPNDYGINNDRHVQSVTHQFWGRALFAYTLPDSKQNFMVTITGGASADTDRFSAYRIGGLLPLASEFPLSIPGYFYQEISATKFVLFNGNYSIPLDPAKRFALNLMAASACVSYLSTSNEPGLLKPHQWNSGIGGGISYHSKSDAWRVQLDYGYGFDAIRDHGRGAQSIGLLFQVDLEHTKTEHYSPDSNSPIIRGMGNFLHSFD